MSNGDIQIIKTALENHNIDIKEINEAINSMELNLFGIRELIHSPEIDNEEKLNKVNELLFEK
jgi:hypothetical protein